MDSYQLSQELVHSGILKSNLKSYVSAESNYLKNIHKRLVGEKLFFKSLMSELRVATLKLKNFIIS